MPGGIQLQRAFLRAPKFAVVGASKNQTKYGTKVLQWYLARSKPVTPVHPREVELEGLRTVPTLAELPEPARTSVHVITPPKVTLDILSQAKVLHVPTIWLQPGVADEEVAKFIQENGMEDRVIYGGPCILRDGDGVLKTMA
ncbi:NAD P-binding protein [Gloeophyllum trabeum ATCC 11539]|uniref:NAD P-binding protein n=1 Tax=Gloeophyllum trabeum (strain ATCC 11539 / FP-39264 / Madison 617) TaxID=670483 RepID=S7RR93_GLOTA|nr:NAD P-binding protein [Gloeophyllum trabeum ATCC 11539]EPQ57145.1 NAD P-binding protein [Gloeophyllum trabeum ATCC 11539]